MQFYFLTCRQCGRHYLAGMWNVSGHGIQELSPGQVTEVRVDGAADNLAADLAELICPVAESNDLSGTHEREVQGVEEEDHILPWGTQNEELIKGLKKNKTVILKT